MKPSGWLLAVGMAITAGPALAGSTACELAKITSSRDLHQALGLRTVELIRRAENPHDDLATLVAPSANFNLGAGDVGRPLETGAAGARQLAELMNADTYRFLGWDHMDSPTDGCSRQKIEVEFIDNQDKSVSLLEFEFEEGRVVNATGWQRSFEAGSVRNQPNH
jgi:hypothetical protein